MVRVTRNSKTSARVAGCAASHHLTRPSSSSTVPRLTRGPIARSAIERDKAKADARQSKKSVEVKARLRSCTSKYGTIFIPATELLNEMPVRVREEVEAIRHCCLGFFPASPRSDEAAPRVSACNLHKHQLFSNEHADNLDPETRQWLPRLVCPAFPLSPKCHGQGQRSDSMLRHLEVCKPFQALFQNEYRRLFPRLHDPRPPVDDEYKILKMTFGQLEFLSMQLGKERRGKKRTFVNMSADKVRTVLQSWRPLSKPGAEVISPCEFPPVRIPQYFYAAGVCRAMTEDEHGGSSGYDADFDTGSSSSSNAPSPIRAPLAIPDEETRHDAPTPPTSSLPTPIPMPTPEPLYPELYLPPHLLPSTCDASYLAAAIAAHAPAIDAFSPLLNVPITSLSAEIPRDCSVTTIGEYDLAFFSREGGTSDHTREFYHIFHSYNRLSPASDVLTAYYQ